MRSRYFFRKGVSFRVGLRAAARGVAVLGFSAAVFAQPPSGGPAARTARERALIDITGQWVSVVSEDWLWRMVTPPAGDTASVPLNAPGREAALAWDRERDVAEDRLCLAFGPPGLIRQPGRIRIRWEDDDTLQLDFDAGTQTRRLNFAAADPPSPPSLQGVSQASWFRESQSPAAFGPGGATTGGALHVRTSNMTPGYLRPNGVPYSEQAVIKEYFNVFSLPGDSGTWLIVTMVVDDPVYLTTEFITSTHFRKETERSGWSPRPCEISPPLIDEPLYVPGPFG
jgi:hypothetical protein